MPIVLARIDDRLIHGQVVEAWIPQARIGGVLVVSAAAAADPMQKALMRLALPEPVALEVLAPAEALARLRVLDAAPERFLLLTPGPREVLVLLEGGARLPAVNVGGMHYAAGKVRLGRAIFLDPQDQRALSDIAARGVKLEGRALPSDDAEDVSGLLGSER